MHLHSALGNSKEKPGIHEPHRSSYGPKGLHQLSPAREVCLLDFVGQWAVPRQRSLLEGKGKSAQPWRL